MKDIINHWVAMGAPGDQNALVGLLKDVQALRGGSLDTQTLGELAETLGLRQSYLAAICRRIPSLRLSDRRVLQLCGGPNCSRAVALAAAAERLCKGRSDLTLSYVGCMRMCGKGPNIKLDGKLYHKADEALLKALLKGE